LFIESSSCKKQAGFEGVWRRQRYRIVRDGKQRKEREREEIPGITGIGSDTGEWKRKRTVKKENGIERGEMTGNIEKTLSIAQRTESTENEGIESIKKLPNVEFRGLFWKLHPEN